MTQPRIAIIGAGAWGLNHVRIVESFPGCDLVAIVDPDPEALARASPLAPRAKLLSEPLSVFADPAVDAVIISSPAPTHFSLASAAIESGKHVLVEKPMAMSVAEAEHLLSLPSAQTVMVGHLMVFHPAVIRLRELLRSGVLGRLHYVHATRANLGRLRRDENALWSFGPHELSMLDYLLGSLPASVSAQGACFLQPGIEDVVFVTLRYPEGEIAHLHLSWLHPRKERSFVLVGARQMVEFDDVAPEKLRIYDRGYDKPPEFTEFAQYLTLRDGDVYIPNLPMQEPLRVQLLHFLDCITQGGLPLTDRASGVRVIKVLEAAQVSLRSGGLPVNLVS